MLRPPPISTLFPYTTLFRSLNSRFYNFYLDQPMSSLTVQIFNYATGPFEVEHAMAWAATLILVATILLINILVRSEEHTSELQSLAYLVCRLLLEKKKNNYL